MSEIQVLRQINGLLVREGAGVKVHRYIGMERTNPFEPILLFDYFDSTEPLDYIAGFPPHPHRGFETITYVLDGQISHEDNKGHKGVILAGDVQWMTAGRGIVHSEMPSSEKGHMRGLQLWLNLPAHEKMQEPRYQEMPSARLPVDHSTPGVSIKVIAGTTDNGIHSPITGIATKPLFFDVHLDLGASVQQHIPEDYQALLFVVSGVVQVGDQLISKGTLAELSGGTELNVTGEEASQCFLIAAKKLHEPIVRHGPFVMNTQEEISTAIDDFRSGRF